MRAFLLRWLAGIIALLAVTQIIPGIRVDAWPTLIVAALMLGLVNATLRPLVVLWTLPVNILSFGILTFFINGLLFYAVSAIVPGFYVTGFWSAFWGALLFSFFSFLVNMFINPSGRFTVQYYQDGPARRSRQGDYIDVESRPDDEKRENKKINKPRSPC